MKTVTQNTPPNEIDRMISDLRNHDDAFESPRWTTSEIANSLIFDEMAAVAFVQLSFSALNLWSVSWSNGVDRDRISRIVDRKLAIALAYIQWQTSISYGDNK